MVDVLGRNFIFRFFTPTKPWFGKKRAPFFDQKWWKNDGKFNSKIGFHHFSTVISWKSTSEKIHNIFWLFLKKKKFEILFQLSPKKSSTFPGKKKFSLGGVKSLETWPSQAGIFFWEMSRIFFVKFEKSFRFFFFLKLVFYGKPQLSQKLTKPQKKKKKPDRNFTKKNFAIKKLKIIFLKKCAKIRKKRNMSSDSR